MKRDHAIDKPIVKGPIDGNAFVIMGAVTRALKKAGQGDKVDEYRSPRHER